MVEFVILDRIEGVQLTWLALQGAVQRMEILGIGDHAERAAQRIARSLADMFLDRARQGPDRAALPFALALSIVLGDFAERNHAVLRVMVVRVQMRDVFHEEIGDLRDDLPRRFILHGGLAIEPEACLAGAKQAHLDLTKDKAPRLGRGEFFLDRGGDILGSTIATAQRPHPRGHRPAKQQPVPAEYQLTDKAGPSPASSGQHMDRAAQHTARIAKHVALRVDRRGCLGTGVARLGAVRDQQPVVRDGRAKQLRDRPPQGAIIGIAGLKRGDMLHAGDLIGRAMRAPRRVPPDQTERQVAEHVRHPANEQDAGLRPRCV